MSELFVLPVLLSIKFLDMLISLLKKHLSIKKSLILGYPRPQPPHNKLLVNYKKIIYS